MKYQSDTKLKTAGGVFLTLLKKHPSITNQVKKKVLKVESERAKERRKTGRLLGAIQLGRDKSTPTFGSLE